MSAAPRRATLLSSLRDANARLREALAQPKNEFLRDASIQRFEFTFELFWKNLKAAAEEAGLEAVSPRDSLRMAFRLGLIDEEPAFFRMIEDRNLTSHTYRVQTAEEIYGRLPRYAALIGECLTRLEERMRQGA
jgi:nucleotidyltransferase substrate binding protein (TIGR01987 family)